MEMDYNLKKLAKFFLCILEKLRKNLFSVCSSLENSVNFPPIVLRAISC